MLIAKGVISTRREMHITLTGDKQLFIIMIEDGKVRQAGTREWLGLELADYLFGA